VTRGHAAPELLAERLRLALEAGTTEHYKDPLLYDHEYQRRRDDLRYYRALAAEVGGPILELGCGTGRLTIPLARDGFEVVGVDLSADMLARLGERLASAGAAARERVQLRQGDFRDLRVDRTFPLVLCPFNTFMHLYSRQDVERFLATVKAHLAPGGLFAFDVMHPDLRWLSRDPGRRWQRTRFRHPRTGKRMVYSTNLVYDAALQIGFMKIYYEPEEGGRTKVVRLTHRYFFPLELEALLHYNGFRIDRHDGDFDGNLLEPESEQQVLRCRRA
jgi:SAM-dependent methyltransferase